MAFRVACRHGHPRGQFHRGGYVFIAGAPVVLDELNEALEAERAVPGSWLVFEEIDGEAASEAQKEQLLKRAGIDDPLALLDDLDVKSYNDLRALATGVGLTFDGRPKKATLVAALREKLLAQVEAEQAEDGEEEED